MSLDSPEEGIPRAQPVVLTVGHCGIPTGFARVLRAISLELRADFELHHFAINQFPEAASIGWPCAVIRNPRANDLHDPSALATVLEALRPDLVLVMDEPWACARLMPAFAGQPRVCTVFYLAIHGGESLPQSVVGALANADHLVAFTKGAKHLLSEALRGLGATTAISVIPHGVDTKAFHPLVTTEEGLPSPERIYRARERIFPGRPDLADAFIVLNANRNQPYKGIDRCLEGFARFAAGKPANVKLYLHMGSRPASLGETPLVDQLGIRDRILPQHASVRHPHVEDEWLNLLYNACDVGINTSQREGWGLISFEHAATGAAQVVPNHSSSAELWPGAAMLLETENSAAEEVFAGGDVRVDAVAEALEVLYADREKHEAVGREGYRLATAEPLRWPHIGNEWRELLYQVMETKRT